MIKLIDQIEKVDARSLTAEWFLTGREDFFADHFEGMPVVPGLILLEMMVSAAIWQLRFVNDFRSISFRLVELSNYKISRIVRPEDRVRVSVELVEGLPETNLNAFRGRAEVGGKAVAQGILKLAESIGQTADRDFYINQCRSQFNRLLPAEQTANAAIQ